MRALLFQFRNNQAAPISKAGGALAAVTISDDGEYATLQVAAKYTRRKLTPIAKEFLRTGNVAFAKGEPFLEPE